jgi:NADPH:quinone reductase-like Zn-dependent oxidoreductase
VRKLAYGGSVAIFGASSGERGEIGFMDLRLAPNSRVMPFRLYESGPGMGRDLEALLALVARGSLRPTIGYRNDWAKLPDALAALRGRAFEGKAVLTVG